MRGTVIGRREALGVIAAATLPACAPEFAVSQRADGNPFAGQHLFRVDPLDIASMRYTPRPLSSIPGEPAVERPPPGLFVAFNTEFLRGLTGTVGNLTIVTKGDGFAIQPIAVSVDPGYNIVKPGYYPKLLASRVVVRVRFTAPGGASDEIEVLCSTPAALVYSAATDRLGHDGLTSGRAAGAHLNLRSAG